MTISAARNSMNKRAGGFTLLEIVFVLLLISLIVGGAVMFMVSSSDERKLKGASGKIEVMAKRARSIAVLQQKPYAIEFAPGSVKLMPYAEALMQSNQPMRHAAPAGLAESGATPIHETFTPEDGMVLSVQRWGNERWFPIRERERQVWRFDPDGLCEPIGLRINMNQSWMENHFHPLTAAVRESSSEIR